MSKSIEVNGILYPFEQIEEMVKICSDWRNNREIAGRVTTRISKIDNFENTKDFDYELEKTIYDFHRGAFGDKNK